MHADIKSAIYIVQFWLVVYLISGFYQKKDKTTKNAKADQAPSWEKVADTLGHEMQVDRAEVSIRFRNGEYHLENFWEFFFGYRFGIELDEYGTYMGDIDRSFTRMKVKDLALELGIKPCTVKRIIEAFFWWGKKV